MTAPAPPRAAVLLSPPTSVEALLARAHAMAGHTLLSLIGPRANRVDDAGDHRPGHRPDHKGGAGMIIERALGADFGGQGPDFAALGVEVKTLPVKDGRVLESTWVTSAHPATLQAEAWRTSAVRHKLARVLFVPLDGAPVPLSARRAGTAFLWSPSPEEERVLQRDWEDLSDLVASGLSFAVSARRGVALQLRPKAKNAAVRRDVLDDHGGAYREAPVGFYLRRSFTQAVLASRFACARQLPQTPRGR